MGKKRITRAIELRRMSGTQRAQWERAMAMQAEIDQMGTIRDNMLRSSADKAFRAGLEKTFAEKIYKARQELNAYMDEIEATRRRLACLLIATQAICDLACTLAGQFADECKRTSGWDEAAKPYKQMVDNAASETRRHIKGIADSGLLWEDVVEMIDAPKSDMVSMGFAEVSQWLTDKVTAIVSDELPAKINPRIYDKF